MTPAELLAISREPNVAAFLAVIRACEGTAADTGYRTLFGGALFDSFADHPRKLVIASGYKSTAAGAYQFLERTWDGLRTQYGLPDFTPAMQDAGAVALLIRRKALDAVRAGRLDEAVELTNDEWASLPGSPYGQPTRSLDFVRRVFKLHGGVEDARPNDAFAGLDLAPIIPPANSAKNSAKPMAPLVPALIGLLSSVAPDLIRIFSDKDKPVSERNTEAAIRVLDIAKQVAGTETPAAAVEQIVADPGKQAAFREAVREQWYELAESGGGGIDGARKTALAVTAGQDWRALGYGVTIALLALLIVGGGGFMLWSLLHDPATTPEQRGMLIGALVALIGSPVAFFFGSSVSSRSKDSAIVQQLGQK